MKNKIMIFALIAVLAVSAFALAGCTKSKNNDSTTTTITTARTTTTTTTETTTNMVEKDAKKPVKTQVKPRPI